MSGAAEVEALDPRGPRAAAALTSVVLAVALLTGSAWILLVQALVFAVGAFGGVTRSPYAVIYQRVIRPWLDPPTAREDARPPRFAQAVGLVVTGPTAVLGLLALPGAVELGAGLALVAALLNAVFGWCLGCEMYLLAVRARGRTRHPAR